MGAPSAAVLFCDLDGFKAVNDHYGHDLGDRLLIAVADRLRDALRGQDQATRLGGDEFVILCSGLSSEAHVMAIAARLRSRICEPFALRGVEVRIGCSIGIATADRPGLRPEDLLDAADRAMYRAKRLRPGIAVHRWPDTRTVDLTVTVADGEEIRAQAVRG
jgi:diguanylate cyclase (GGDEF)-like protein